MSDETEPNPPETLAPAQRQMLVTHLCIELDRLANSVREMGMPAQDVLMAFAEAVGRIAWNIGGKEFSVNFMHGIGQTLASFEPQRPN